MTPTCELCKADRFTHWYSADDTCWVADCEACLVPMVVWNTHGIDPSPEQLTHMEQRLAEAARSRFGDDWVIDPDRRSIPDHFHLHARDPQWFSQRSQRRMSIYTGVGGERIEQGAERP